jgi:mRNA interferase RelE/StbE
VAFKIEFHPEAARDFDSLDGSVQKEVGKKIDSLAENPFLGKPLGNKLGLDLTGFYKLYAFRQRIPIHKYFLFICGTRGRCQPL